jgi:hypothetical protein
VDADILKRQTDELRVNSFEYLSFWFNFFNFYWIL